jgi:hypothetical protein
VCILDTVAAGVAERQNGGCASCQFQVRPNPTLGTMTVTAPATGGGRVSVWDATGRMVAVAALDRQGRATIDIGDAPCGLYFVETHQNGIRRAVKVAKQ